jgi:hypothetical protein
MYLLFHLRLYPVVFIAMDAFLSSRSSNDRVGDNDM